MANITHEVEAIHRSASDRCAVICPDCKAEWSSLFIKTAVGLLYDPVSCDCQTDILLVPPKEVIDQFIFENKDGSHQYWPFLSEDGKCHCGMCPEIPLQEDPAMMCMDQRYV